MTLNNLRGGGTRSAAKQHQPRARTLASSARKPSRRTRWRELNRCSRKGLSPTIGVKSCVACLAVPLGTLGKSWRIARRQVSATIRAFSSADQTTAARSRENVSAPEFTLRVEKRTRMPRSPLPQATSATGEPLKKAAEARLRWICFLNRSRPRQLSETSCSCRQQTAPSRHRRSVWLRALSNTGAPLGAKRASLMAVTKVGWRLR